MWHRKSEKKIKGHKKEKQTLEQERDDEHARTRRRDNTIEQLQKKIKEMEAQMGEERAALMETRCARCTTCASARYGACFLYVCAVYCLCVYSVWHSVM